MTEAFTNTSDVDTLYSTLGEVDFSKFIFPNHVTVKIQSMDVCIAYSVLYRSAKAIVKSRKPEPFSQY